MIRYDQVVKQQIVSKNISIERQEEKYEKYVVVKKG